MPKKYIGLVLVPSLCLAFAPVSHAEFPEPGYYAILCGRMFRGKTASAAMGACVSAEKHGRFRGVRQCDCARHVDLVHFEPTTQPAFFVAGEYYAGDTPEQATRACAAKQNPSDKTSESNLDSLIVPCADVRKVYGPYARKPHRPNNDTNDFDDSEKYRFLNFQGLWVDKHGRPTCFVAGTPIATPSGNTPIEALVPGDLVRSWSVEEGRMVTARVTYVKTRTVAAVLEVQVADGRSLRLTANHPLESPSRGAWIAAGELRVGDTLATVDGPEMHPISITEIRPAPAAQTAEITVYDVTVAPTHSYFANGIWAHNY